MADFDPSFYEAFTTRSHERIAALRDAARALTSSGRVGDLHVQASTPLHNMVGEARLLDLADLARQTHRLLVYAGAPGQAPRMLDAHAAAEVADSCEALMAWITAVLRDGPRMDAPERARFVSCVQALEKV